MLTLCYSAPELKAKEALLQQECDRSQNLQSHAHQLETNLESQQMISLLASEKASPAATLERLGDSETCESMFYSLDTVVDPVLFRLGCQ
jgi:hypothetical protein